MKIGSLGKIYQNSPMPPPKNLNFSIILIKTERTSAYENSILDHNLWKILEKTKIFIILMKRSPPTQQNDIFSDILSKFSEKSGGFIILNHLFLPEIGKIHISR